MRQAETVKLIQTQQIEAKMNYIFYTLHIKTAKLINLFTGVNIYCKLSNLVRHSSLINNNRYIDNNYND